MEPQCSLPCSQEPCTFALSWAKCIQSTTLHPISVRSILILLSHLHSALFPSGSQQKYIISHISHTCYMSRPPHSPRFDRPSNIWWRLSFMKLLIVQSSPAARHFLPLRSKYSPQHSVRRHRQAVFFLYCDRPKSTDYSNLISNAMLSRDFCVTSIVTDFCDISEIKKCVDSFVYVL
jgi:hypothetical protein